MKSNRKIIILIILMFLVAAVFTFLILRNGWSNNEIKQAPTTTKAEKNGIKVTTVNNSPKSQSDNTTNKTVGVTKPNGAFVSNHRPNLDGDPAPNQINSVCQTTAGAFCEIRFTKNNEVKSLGPTKVGSDGYANWDWKLQDLGLSEGSWQIEAIATSGDQKVTTADSLNLEVGS